MRPLLPHRDHVGRRRLLDAALLVVVAGVLVVTLLRLTDGSREPEVVTARKPERSVPAASEPYGPPLPPPDAGAVSVDVETPRLERRAAAAAAPLRLAVPRLDVDSPVLPITGSTGVLEPPSDPLELGWWQEGAVPGASRGSSVMTGHTVHTGGGALDHLARLRPGDEVTVTTARGKVVYEVRTTWVLSKPELAERAVDLFDQERPGRLVLVTCFDWNGVEYLSNAVVAAVPVSSAVTAG